MIADKRNPGDSSHFPMRSHPDPDDDLPVGIPRPLHLPSSHHRLHLSRIHCDRHDSAKGTSTVLRKSLLPGNKRD